MKVLDFGIVKKLDLHGVEATQLSQSVVTGTPPYLSPEAIESQDRVDARSDIYAVGCVAYFLLTGTNVFNGESIVEICAHHLHTEPEPPSRRSALPVPFDLEAVVLRCLAKSQEARFPDVVALHDALGRCGAADDWPRQRAVEWWNEHRGSTVRGGEVERVPHEEETIAVDLVAR